MADQITPPPPAPETAHEPAREPAVMSVRSAAVWSMASQYGGFVIQFATSVIISRFFLAPDEVGLFSIALAAAMLVAVLQDFGLSRYISGLPSLTPEEVHRCSSVAVIFSLLITTSALFSQSTRTALLEVSESTLTPSNASIICAKEEVRSAFSEDEVVILAQHYNDVQNDPLFKQFSKEWALSLFVNGFTVGGVDRVSYNGTSMVLNPSVWVDTITARINRPTDGLVTLPEVLYDANINEVYVRVQLDFTDSSIFNREMRFFCYLVQDGVEADQYLAIDALEIDSSEIPD